MRFKSAITNLKFSSTILKITYSGIAYTCFLLLFVFTDFENWQQKYHQFNVPAYDYPGADLRGLQMAYICRENGENYIGDSECVTNAVDVKRTHPNAVVPNFNYPQIWVDIYAIVGGKSENDVVRIWLLNAILTSLLVVILTYKNQFVLGPLILFSPVFLLLIERGNTDGFMFILAFAPFVLFKRSEFLKISSLLLAGVLKVFPLFGFLGLIELNRKQYKWFHVIPAFLLTPLLFKTFSELQTINEVTMKHYSASFGIESFGMIPWVSNIVPNHIYLYLVYLILVILIAGNLYLWKNFKDHVSRIVQVDNSKDFQIVAVSLFIIVLTSLATSNWAYRFIFAIPAMLVLSKSRDPISASICLLALIIFWIPFFNGGWLLFNYFSIIFSIVAAAYLLAAYAHLLISNLARTAHV